MVTDIPGGILDRRRQLGVADTEIAINLLEGDLDLSGVVRTGGGQVGDIDEQEGSDSSRVQQLIGVGEVLLAERLTDLVTTTVAGVVRAHDVVDVVQVLLHRPGVVFEHAGGISQLGRVDPDLISHGVRCPSPAHRCRSRTR